MTSEYLEWSELEIIKQTITNELIKIGVNVTIDSWMKGEMAYDILEFSKDSVEYHMFASCRLGKMFGFGSCKKRTCDVIFNESIKYDDMFKAKIHDLIQKI